MMLFQIEEPDGPPEEALAGAGTAVGIDLSSERGGAVAVALGGNAELLPERDGTRRGPLAPVRQADGTLDVAAAADGLRALRGRAEKMLMRPVTHAVVVVDDPCEADGAALAAAAEAAGLVLLRRLDAAAAARRAGRVPALDAAVLGAAIQAEDDAPAAAPA